MKIKEKWVSWEEFYKIQSGIFSPAAHSHISSEVGGLTLGSIPFADAAGVLVEDNTELFWDSGTDMMGIGGAPSAKLDVYGDVMVGHAVTGTIHFKDVAGNQVAFIQNVGGIIHVDADSDITLDPNNTERLRLLSAGNMAFGVTAVGANAVKVFGIGSGTAPTTSPANMVQLWVEDRGAGYAQLHYRAEGGLRDAESLLDQILTFHEKEVTAHSVASALGIMPRDVIFELDRAGKEGDLAVAFTIANRVFSEGKDLPHFLEMLAEHFRHILVVKFCGKNAPMLSLSNTDREKYAEIATFYRQEQCLSLLDY